MQQTLFLFVGYPGSGKTTTAEKIHELTGAVHIWADHERKERFSPPTYSRAESEVLYAILNDLTDKLLSEGKSVIYDTNFNFRRDRDLLRRIAASHGARTVVVWVKASLELARHRATEDDKPQRTRVFGTMARKDFDRISSHLQPPAEEEHVITFDGRHVTKQAVEDALRQL